MFATEMASRNRNRMATVVPDGHVQLILLHHSELSFHCLVIRISGISWFKYRREYLIGIPRATLSLHVTLHRHYIDTFTAEAGVVVPGCGLTFNLHIPFHPPCLDPLSTQETQCHENTQTSACQKSNQIKILSEWMEMQTWASLLKCMTLGRLSKGRRKDC